MENLVKTYRQYFESKKEELSQEEQNLKLVKITKDKASKLFEDGTTIYVLTEPSQQPESANTFSLKKGGIDASLNMYSKTNKSFDEIIEFIEERQQKYQIEVLRINAKEPHIWKEGGEFDTEEKAEAQAKQSRKMKDLYKSVTVVPCPPKPLTYYTFNTQKGYNLDWYNEEIKGKSLTTESKEVTDETYIKTIKYNGKKLTLHKVADTPLKTQFYLDTMSGETYIDINKILPDNLLMDAIWVEKGGTEEKIADTLDILSKTDRTTKSGYNTYILYNIK